MSVYSTLHVQCTRWRKETDYYQYHNNMNLFKDLSTVDVFSNDPPPLIELPARSTTKHFKLSSDQHWKRNRRFSIRNLFTLTIYVLVSTSWTHESPNRETTYAHYTTKSYQFSVGKTRILICESGMPHFFRNVTWIACLRVLEITARNPLFISNSPS